MKKTNKVFVSIIIPVKNEDRLLHHTVKSVCRSIDHASNNGVSCEIILVWDKVDNKTNTISFKYIKPQLHKYNHSFVKVNGRSLGSMRNHGIKKSQGVYIGMVEAGDLMSENWIYNAMKTIRGSKANTVVYPEYSLTFNGQYRLQKTIDSTSKAFAPEFLVDQTVFPSLFIAPRKLFENYPFCEEDIKCLRHLQQHWVCDTVVNLVAHKKAPKTLVACNSSTQSECYELLPPTKYLATIKKSNTTTQQGDLNKSQTKNIKEKTLKLGTKVASLIHNSFLAKQLRASSPRLNEYLTSRHLTLLHLLRPIDQVSILSVPEWLVHEVRELNKIDLRVFYIEHLQAHSALQEATLNTTTLAVSYCNLVNNIGEGVDYLFVVPYLKNGGAEKELGHTIDAILKLKPGSNIKVFATENSDSPWAKNLPKEVKFISPSESFFSLSQDQQAQLIALLCIQLRPKRIHVMNTVPAYIALSKFASDISKYTRIFLTMFMIDKTTEGMPAHNFVYHMEDAIDYVDKVFTDNKTVVDQLTNLMAINDNKFSVHYQPAEIKRIELSQGVVQNHFTKIPIKILWAGRLDRQKRPDILVKIAHQCANKKMPVEFHAYGSPAFDGQKYLAPIQKSQYIKYHGPYTGGLKSLPTAEYDIFLLTSEWEGMPNVLLEAIVEGLLVIAPDVGGVSELIKDDNTGMLVEKFNDVHSYSMKLEKVIENPEHARNIVSQAQKHVSTKHSIKEFTKNLIKEKNYV